MEYVILSNHYFSQSSLEEQRWRVQLGNSGMCCHLCWSASVSIVPL